MLTIQSQKNTLFSSVYIWTPNDFTVFRFRRIFGKLRYSEPAAWFYKVSHFWWAQSWVLNIYINENLIMKFNQWQIMLETTAFHKIRFKSFRRSFILYSKQFGFRSLIKKSNYLIEIDIFERIYNFMGLFLIQYKFGHIKIVVKYSESIWTLWIWFQMKIIKHLNNLVKG